MTPPVLFLFFNRPETAQKVFSAIREAWPERLFLAADGPRPDVVRDAELCQMTRASVESLIDWPCEVHRLYRDKNLGCREAVSSAIDWYFSHVEEGIILEDDTLPDPSFFHFATAMLARYRNNPEIMHISGNNHQHGRIRGNGAYYASRFAHSWGWATWRRAWKLYDRDMAGFPENWSAVSAQCRLAEPIQRWWKMALENTRAGVVNTWDFQWHYTIMKNKGVCLIPNRNLVCNIGVGADATHMKQKDVASSIRPGCLMRFDAPSSLEINWDADQFDFDHSVTNRPPPWRTPAEVWHEWRFKNKQSAARGTAYQS
jgi:hypothetical protein